MSPPVCGINTESSRIDTQVIHISNQARVYEDIGDEGVAVERTT